MCAYYWRIPDGVVSDGGLNRLRGKLAALEGRASFLVEMCTEVNGISDVGIASERLENFAVAVDPEVRRLMGEATENGK
jgi:hypothetical protein